MRHFAELLKRNPSIAITSCCKFSTIAALNRSVEVEAASISVNPCTQATISPTAPIQSPNVTNLAYITTTHSHFIKTHFLESQDHTVEWNNLIRSYTRLCAFQEAVGGYLDMLRAGFAPDRYTLPITLKAAAQIYSIRTGHQFHAVAVLRGIELDEFCESGLISMYVKAGDIESARKVFDENPNKKLGSWNALIGGLSRIGCAKDAVEMFVKMMRAGLKPDDVMMLSVMLGCGRLGDLNLALQLHKCVLQVKNSTGENVLMMNSVIDMYGKCGRMDLAHKVFSEMANTNVSSWTSMIVGYATRGLVEEAIKCFNEMIQTKVEPNHVTFLGVLCSCVHGGLVEEGKHYFNLMKDVYGIKPQPKHYGCMVDLLGRVGLLEEARNMIQNIPVERNMAIWGCLMGACEKHSNIEIGEWVADHLIELEPQNDGAYVVLSNIYASRNMWTEVGRLREAMKQRKLTRVPGWSHSFLPVEEIRDFVTKTSLSEFSVASNANHVCLDKE